MINFISDGMKIRDNTSNLIVSRFLINVEDPEDKEDDESDEENLKELTQDLSKKYKYSKKKIEKLERQIINVKKKQRK